MPAPKSPIERAADKLRSIALSAGEGTMVGNEDVLIETLAVSRPTLRQAARMLEQEGLLRTRRGLNGGYFAARPSMEMIEITVCNYLEILGMEAEDVVIVARGLWIEAMRKAASLRTAQAKALAEEFRERISPINEETNYENLLEEDMAFREAIFDLINSRYLTLIFRINVAFARRRTDELEGFDQSSYVDFVRAWRSAKSMELEAIATGDPELAAMAARRSRDAWLLDQKYVGMATPR